METNQLYHIGMAINVLSALKSLSWNRDNLRIYQGCFPIYVSVLGQKYRLCLPILRDILEFSRPRYKSLMLRYTE